MARSKVGLLKAKMGVREPTRQDSPMLPQPPPSVNVKKTELALGRVELPITQSVMTTARKPAVWMKKAKIWTCASFWEKTELKRIAIVTTRMMRSVSCQR